MSPKIMKINACKPSNGFTLVELMVVIAIMAILATIGVTSFAFVQERQNKEKARVQIALLSNAIEEYKRDMGEYPGTDEDTAVDGDVSEELYTALFYEGFGYTDPVTPPTDWDDKATKIYIKELDPRTSKVGWLVPLKTLPDEPPKILDPWGATYRYRKGTNAENPDFDLWSMGKDGVSNTKDDIRNF